MHFEWYSRLTVMSLHGQSALDSLAGTSVFKFYKRYYPRPGQWYLFHQVLSREAAEAGAGTGPRYACMQT